ncbi:MAG: hypothetical protein EZS28_009962 [Streblomastix strix]|uniref:Uncharacterized protein n=1 Tax=Streblomastix strix TaxID=222440 RepID=A0A5J4WHX5_9EUKA|nr:MAG: hypothetical protein EZS28_009962 [Streblomastix strix]
MAQRGTKLIDGEHIDLTRVVKIPQMLKNEGFLLKRRTIAGQKQQIINKIRAIDPSITQLEGAAGILSLTSKTRNREVYGPLFDEDLRSEFFENAVISFFEDQPTTIPSAQEILIEKQQQAVEKALAQKENLAQVYDPGSLDWERMPVNDQYSRQQFKTQKTGNQMNSDGSLSAIIKKENIKVTPGEKKPKTKKNYIPTSQLLQSANEQGKLSKKKKGKKK